MVEYGYARGSTDEVDLENQYRLLADAGVQIHNIFSDTAVSGTISPNERGGWHRMDQRLQKGDVVVVVSVDRIGRQSRFIPDTLHDFHKRGVQVKSLADAEQCLQYIGSDDPALSFVGSVLAEAFGMIAAIEREAIVRRTKAGLATARANGKQIGGGHFKLGPTEREALRQDRKVGLSWSQLSDRYGVVVSTCKRIVKEGT